MATASKLGERWPGRNGRNLRWRQGQEHAQSQEQAEASRQGTQGGHGKTVVMGMLERGGQVRAKVVREPRKETALARLSKPNVKDGSHLITDEAEVDTHLTTRFIHEVINHVEEYVRGHIHTNGIENFWSLLKRGLNGTYVNVEPFHLPLRGRTGLPVQQPRNQRQSFGRCRPLHAGSLADRRQTADLCGIDRQGGRAARTVLTWLG